MGKKIFRFLCELLFDARAFERGSLSMQRVEQPHRLGRIIFDSDLVQILQMINTPVIRRYIAFNVIKLDVDIFAYE